MKIDEKPVGGRWHFALKFDPDADIYRYKARFVANVLAKISENIFMKHIHLQLDFQP